MTPTTLTPGNTGATVDVSIFPGGHSVVPTAWMFRRVIRGHESANVPSYSFLIEHKQSHQKILYDLGFSKDWKETIPPAILSPMQAGQVAIDVGVDVPDQLTEANVDLHSISAIIWSHHHPDHVGDPSRFPSSTSLLVGPGLKSNEAIYPGYPQNPDAVVSESAFKGREVIELDFSASGLSIGGFPAIDYFNDGSLYILASKGHTHNHISALARTSENKFIFLGGDIARHPGEFRPTTQLHLPTELDSSILGERFGSVAPCPGSLFEKIHPGREGKDWDYKTTPFYEPNSITTESPDDALAALERLQTFDRSAEVFIIVSHDAGLLDVLPFFPSKITDWDSTDLKNKGTWVFLKDFVKALH